MVAQFPQTLPANSVVGRLGTGSGPSQAIPFDDLAAALGIGQNVIFVDLFGVVPDGTDQTANLQAAIDRYSPSGATLQFVVGTYIFNSAIILKPNIVLRGAGIDATILKVGVDNISLIDRWGAVGADSGTSGIEFLTAWGYQDRNSVANTSKLVSFGPFNYYWARSVKIIYSNSMGIAGIGGVGMVDSCIVNQCLRDGINLTGTTHVQVIDNDISQVGDDAIAYHLASGTSGINDNSCRIIGNRIEKSFGIKLLGARNTVVSDNVIRFYTGYGIFVGIDSGSNEGQITRFGISITGNTMLDGLNANVFGGGNIAYGIFLTGGQSLGTGGSAIAQNVGTYNAPGQFIQKPDVFINKAGADQPRGSDGTISIVSNDIRQTLAGMTNFSDAGFGLLWYNTGSVNPAITTLLGEVAGIGIHTDLENAVISDNTMHGVGNGIEAVFGVYNVIISRNNIFRIRSNGIALIGGAVNNGCIVIEHNIVDCDPYLESPARTVPINGTWTVTDGANMMCVLIQNYAGVSVRNNRFRNCIRVIKSIGTSNWIAEGNVVEFDWSGTNRGISTLTGANRGADIFWFCNSDPTSPNFNKYDLDFTLSSNAQPTAGFYLQGTFVRNNTPTLDANNLSILGWLRRTDGNTHVAGTDWMVARVSHVSPAT